MPAQTWNDMLFSAEALEICSGFRSAKTSEFSAVNCTERLAPITTSSGTRIHSGVCGPITSSGALDERDEQRAAEQGVAEAETRARSGSRPSLMPRSPAR